MLLDRIRMPRGKKILFPRHRGLKLSFFQELGGNLDLLYGRAGFEGARLQACRHVAQEPRAFRP